MPVAMVALRPSVLAGYPRHQRHCAEVAESPEFVFAHRPGLHGVLQPALDHHFGGEHLLPREDGMRFRFLLRHGDRQYGGPSLAELCDKALKMEGDWVALPNPL